MPVDRPARVDQGGQRIVQRAQQGRRVQRAQLAGGQLEGQRDTADRRRDAVQQGDRLRCRLDPATPGGGDQQPGRRALPPRGCLVGQRVQADGPFHVQAELGPRGDQPGDARAEVGQPVHHRGRALDLLHVVQQHDAAPAGELVGDGGDRIVAARRLDRAGQVQGHLGRGGDTAQIDQARAPGPGLPGRLGGAAGLAEPAGSGHREHRRTGVDQLGEAGDDVVPADELARPDGQGWGGRAPGRGDLDLVGPHHHPGQPGVAALDVVVYGDAVLELQQFRAGCRAHLLLEFAPGLRDGGQGAHRVPGQVQGRGQVQPEPFIGRLLGDQGAQRPERVRGDAPPDIGRGPFQAGAAAQLHQPLPEGTESVEVASGERLAPPEGQGLVQPAHPLVVVPDGPCGGHQGFEVHAVDLGRRQLQEVAGRCAVGQRDPALTERLANPLDVALQRLGGGPGWVVRPEQVDQGRRPHRGAGVQRQQTEYRDLLAAGQRHRPARSADPHGTQQIDPDAGIGDRRGRGRRPRGARHTGRPAGGRPRPTVVPPVRRALDRTPTAGRSEQGSRRCGWLGQSGCREAARPPAPDRSATGHPGVGR